MEKNGIEHITSTNYFPEQNSLVECMHQTLFGDANTCLIASGLPQDNWAWAVRSTAYVQNLLTTKTKNVIFTPYVRIFNKPPPLNHIRVLGCNAYTLKDGDDKKVTEKRDKHTLIGKMVGYS